MVRSADAVRAGWRARLAGDRPPYGLILAGYAVIVVVLTIAVTITSKAPEYPSVQTGPAWLDSWFQFDSVWYYTIATGGYSFTPGAAILDRVLPDLPDGGQGARGTDRRRPDRRHADLGDLRGGGDVPVRQVGVAPAVPPRGGDRGRR